MHIVIYLLTVSAILFGSLLSISTFMAAPPDPPRQSQQAAVSVPVSRADIARQSRHNAELLAAARQQQDEVKRAGVMPPAHDLPKIAERGAAPVPASPVTVSPPKSQQPAASHAPEPAVREQPAVVKQEPPQLPPAAQPPVAQATPPAVAQVAPPPQPEAAAQPDVPLPPKKVARTRTAPAKVAARTGDYSAKGKIPGREELDALIGYRPVERRVFVYRVFAD